MTTIKVFDNPETECRELWINNEIKLALSATDLNKNAFKSNDILSRTMSVGQWEAGKEHMNTEGIDELVHKSRA